MATLNELGRNSSVITYGPSAAGADIWPAFSLTDQWIRNETLQGSAVASGTTVTGNGTLFLTQLRANDVVLIGGQARTVSSVTSDSVFTVSSAFSPDITIPSAIKMLYQPVTNPTTSAMITNPSLTGTVSSTVRGTTMGTCSVTNGLTTVLGYNTYWWSDLTNSVTTVALTGSGGAITVDIDTSGNITGYNTQFNNGGDNLQVGSTTRLQPSDCIVVSASNGLFYFEVATVTSGTVATVQIPPLVAITGATIAKATNGTAGRTVLINGRARVVTAVTSNTQMTVNLPFDFTDSNLKLKEYPRGFISTPTLVTSTTSGSISTTACTVAAAPTGAVVGATIVVTAGTGAYPPGTTIVAISGTTITTSVAPSATISASATVTITNNALTTTGANLLWDLQSGDQVWIGDDIRQLNTVIPLTLTATSSASTTVTVTNTAGLVVGMNLTLISGTGTAIANTITVANITSTTVFTTTANVSINSGAVVNAYSATLASITDWVNNSNLVITTIRQTYTNVPFHRDATYITGSGTAFLSEVRAGDGLVIGGTEVVVAAVLSNTLLRLSYDFTHTVSGATAYKKKPNHGYIFEGSREGIGTTATAYKFTTATTASATTGYVAVAGSNTITVATATSFVANNFIKIVNGGGAPILLSGYIAASAAGTTLNGVNTLFTKELFLGAEICVAGQHLVVTAITSDVAATVGTFTLTQPTVYYRTIPLYTYIISVATSVMTLAHALKNSIYSTAANPVPIYTPSALTDYVEYVYSAPNRLIESTDARTLNQGVDRKYTGFRYFPLNGSATINPSTACGYHLTVYERWVAGYAQSGGVGINIADRCALVATGTGIASDLSAMTQGTGGGYIYLYAKPRYLIIQGRAAATGTNTQWVGCIEFERTQPEDIATASTTTISPNSVPSGVVLSGAAPVAPTANTIGTPYPTFAYVNGNRFPVGCTQTPTLPISIGAGVHGGLFSVPRIRSPALVDLTGIHAHIYTACTITTGRWGHIWETGALGPYTDFGAITTGTIAGTADAIPTVHMGQIVPVNTNVYNSKRFMFSPIVLLGPAYDPDIRGRMFGIKVIPSGVGVFMDTVSIPVDSTDFYDSTQTSVDHWIITASVTTYTARMSATDPVGSYRSLELAGPATASTHPAVTNSFRWAIPT